MAQIGIREYDAKRMFFEYIDEKYSGIQVKNNVIFQEDKTEKYVVKPDMLFGKRGKLGLLGVGLSVEEVQKWLTEKNNQEVKINNVTGKLNAFLVEKFVPHEQEYYISFSAHRDYDLVSFSVAGGIDIEENWEQVKSIKIPTLENVKEEQISTLITPLSLEGEGLGVRAFILQLWGYYKTYGFVYLEVNPFCFHEKTGELVLLDMVAKIDDQEYFKQKNNWENLEFPPTFGFQEESSEKYIRELDEGTGASLKFKILNPQASIWTLTSGGGGSLVITDTLGALGYAKNIGNYGELSGNPDFGNTYEYAKTLFEQMLKSENAKYLVIAGAIANFTNIATSFKGIISALQEVQEEFVKRKIQILVRRGGINEKEGLEYLEEHCKKMGIDIMITGSSEYMTDILKEITL